MDADGLPPLDFSKFSDDECRNIAALIASRLEPVLLRSGRDLQRETELEDDARQVVEYMERRSALLSLLHDGYIDQEILDLFETGGEGWCIWLGRAARN